MITADKVSCELLAHRSSADFITGIQSAFHSQLQAEVSQTTIWDWIYAICTVRKL